MYTTSVYHSDLSTEVLYLNGIKHIVGPSISLYFTGAPLLYSFQFYISHVNVSLRSPLWILLFFTKHGTPLIILDTSRWTCLLFSIFYFYFTLYCNKNSCCYLLLVWHICHIQSCSVCISDPSPDIKHFLSHEMKNLCLVYTLGLLFYCVFKLSLELSSDFSDWIRASIFSPLLCSSNHSDCVANGVWSNYRVTQTSSLVQNTPQ